MRRALRTDPHADATINRATQTEEGIACPFCGLIQLTARVSHAQLIQCSRCRSPLERTHAKSIEVTLVLCVSALVLLIPTLLAPFLTTFAWGASRTSILPSSVTTLWNEGWPVLAIVVGVVVVLLPLGRLLTLAAVLASLKLNRHPRWGRVFRYSCVMEPWAMLDVFLLAFAVAYARLRASINVTIGPGAIAFQSVAILTLVVRATLDKRALWGLIAPDRPLPSGALSVCSGCELILPAEMERHVCPRCAATVQARRASLEPSVALLIAAIALYLPANIYPIATLPINLKPPPHTRYLAARSNLRTLTWSGSRC